MGFANRTCTTSKPQISEKANKGAKLLYQHQILRYVEEYSVSPSIILSFNQHLWRMLQSLVKGSKHVAITGSLFKQATTVTFGITCETKFLLIQLMNGARSKRSILWVKFPGSFWLSANWKHFSNTLESLKLLDEIVIPYIEKGRTYLQPSDDQPAFFIIDVLFGQMTEPAIKKIRENSIKLDKVALNMTQLFQPLDLTVNGVAKAQGRIQGKSS